MDNLGHDDVFDDRHQGFCVAIPVDDKVAMRAFQETMDVLAESSNKHIEELAASLGICDSLAMDLWYLRTRSRWTPELEDAYVAASRDGYKLVPNGDEVELLMQLGYLDAK